MEYLSNMNIENLESLFDNVLKTAKKSGFYDLDLSHMNTDDCYMFLAKNKLLFAYVLRVLQSHGVNADDRLCELNVVDVQSGTYSCDTVWLTYYESSVFFDELFSRLMVEHGWELAFDGEMLYRQHENSSDCIISSRDLDIKNVVENYIQYVESSDNCIDGVRIFRSTKYGHIYKMLCTESGVIDIRLSSFFLKVLNTLQYPLYRNVAVSDNSFLSPEDGACYVCVLEGDFADTGETVYFTLLDPMSIVCIFLLERLADIIERTVSPMKAFHIEGSERCA